MIRADFALPFRIGPGAGQAAQAAYQDHVEQMVRQALLTDPGERADLPEFGAGLRRLIFAPMSVGLQASAQMAVTQTLNRWLGDQITVRAVTVRTADDRTSPADAGADSVLPEGAILIRVEYELIETRTIRQTELRVS